MERAHAIIEKGTVRLGNARIERRWNAFLGTTVELLYTPEGADSLTRRSPEFHLDYDGRPVAAPDLGDITWSESVDSHGASIKMELRGPGIAFSMETVLLHDNPAFLRLMSVTNTAGSPVELTRAAADVLPLDATRYVVGDPAGDAVPGGRVGGKPVHYVSLRGDKDTFLIGASRETRFALFDPNPAYCAPVWEGSVFIPPGKTWQGPPVSLLWLHGPEAAEPARAIARLHHAWEARNAASAVFHPSRN